jgi:hypothetical protein
MVQKKAKVKLELRTKSVPEKVQFSGEIVTNMKDNANFPKPSPGLEEISKISNELRLANSEALAARQISESKTKIQEQKEDKFDSALTKLAHYVEDASDGDAAKIKSAGMESWVPGGGAPIGELPAPENFSASSGDKAGEIDLDWDNVSGAKSYIMQKQLDPHDDTQWEHAGIATKSKAIIENLERGKQYW